LFRETLRVRQVFDQTANVGVVGLEIILHITGLGVGLEKDVVLLAVDHVFYVSLVFVPVDVNVEGGGVGLEVDVVVLGQGGGAGVGSGGEWASFGEVL
jgi:hypothetical protein